MKVVYNNCFGGFGLSPIALTEFAKKKGVSLFWYKQTGYQHEGNERYIKLESVPSSGGFDLFSCTKDLGEEIKAIDSDFHYYSLHELCQHFFENFFGNLSFPSMYF